MPVDGTNLSNRVTDPMLAKARRMEWRQHLQDRLAGPQCQALIDALASELANQYARFIECFSIISDDIERFKSIRDVVREFIRSAIVIRAKTGLSSFRYVFQWIAAESTFDHKWMKTPFDTGVSGPRFNKVRFAATPRIGCRRPRGLNEFARENTEFSADEFGPAEQIRAADVVCVNGRMQSIAS